MSNTQQPEALRLAHLLALDKWPDAAAELRRQHARIAELDSEATENARIIGASAETELALRGRIAKLEAARIAYASEFEPDADGDPDVGNIHANIRALKAQLSACINLLKKTPKITRDLYVGKDRESWGMQAKAVLDAAVSALGQSKGKKERNEEMNTPQPDALRLADWLDDQYDPDHHKADAATELRRQHKRIAELESQLGKSNHTPQNGEGGKWLTVVYRDVQSGDEVQAIINHPKASALSWSHAIYDRDVALTFLKPSKEDHSNDPRR